MNNTILILGSNIEPKKKYIDDALAMIRLIIGKITQTSSLWETEPWGFNSQNMFINMSCIVKTKLTPSELINNIIKIEQKLGRYRKTTETYNDRNIDIDIIFYNNEIIKQPGIIIPHPHFHNRRFMLEPLNEIIPTYINPITKTSISEILTKCPDKSYVKKLS